MELMCVILLSIKPEYVDKIFAGNKRYEFRRKGCKRQVSKIVIYATCPVRKVLGEMEIKQVLVDSPLRLWECTKQYAGIDENLFFKYFQGCSIAYGYEVKNVIRYNRARDLSEYGIAFAPQSYIYLNRE